MKKYFMFFAVALFFGRVNATTTEGGMDAGGGTIVACEGSADFPARMGYSLDYAMAIGSGMRSTDFADIQNWEQSSFRIHTILYMVSTDLAQSFFDFIRSTSQLEGDYKSPNPVIPLRVWSPGFVGRPMGDGPFEDLKLLPSECSNSLAIFRGIQIIRRTSYTKFPSVITYKFDKEMLAHLRSNHPLSGSFILVHEWLWDWTRNATVSRRVNAFLHSREIEHMSRPQVLVKLHSLGLNF